MQCPGCSRPLPAAGPRCPHCNARVPMSDLPTSDLGAPEKAGASAAPSAAAAPHAAGSRRAAPALAPGSLFAGREALISYKRAIELKPDSIASWNNLGGALLRLRNGPDAVKACERSLSIQESPESHTNLGTALYYAGRYEEASAQYRLATVLDPRGAVYWKNLGDAETMLYRAPEARQACLRARDLARARAAATPPDPPAHRQLAI